jgi:ankyrin repeat protein
MLPINSGSVGPHQAQLQEKINELNNLESWGSWEVALVSEKEIHSILDESFESLKSSPNEALSYSLLKLADRIKSEEYFGLEVKNLASQVQNVLGTSSVFPINMDLTLKVLEELGKEDLSNVSQVSHEGNKVAKEAATPKKIFPMDKDPTLKVLEKLGIEDLSNLSKVSHYGNKVAKEAIIAKAGSMGYKGNDLNGSISYSISYMKDLTKELERINYFSDLNLDNVDKDTILENLKNLPQEKLISLCKDTRLYKDRLYGGDLFPRLRNFLNINYEIKAPPLGNDKDALDALEVAGVRGGVDIVKLLLKMGVSLETLDLDIAKRYMQPECFDLLTGSSTAYMRDLKQELEKINHFSDLNLDNVDKDTILENLKNLPQEKLISLCKDSRLYKDRHYGSDWFPNLRHFLNLNYEIKAPPLGNDKDALHALEVAGDHGGVDIVKLLLKMGVSLEQLDLGNAKRYMHPECVEILVNALKSQTRL